MASDGNPRTIWQLIGGNLQRIRGDRSQDELAAMARRGGLPWSRQVISALEAGTRELNLGEVLLLCTAIGASPTDLLAGEEEEWVILQPRGEEPSVLDLPGLGTYTLMGSMAKAMPIGDLRNLVSGPKPARAVVKTWAQNRQKFDESTAAVTVEMASRHEAELHIARKLGVEPADVARAAVELWGTSLTEERDRRVAVVRQGDGDRRAIRGHVTRNLIAELRPKIKKGD
jgi:hypothetical protein